MATKAKPSTAVAVKKASSGAVVDIQAQLRAQAAAMNERTAPPSGNKISVGGKRFKFPDGHESDGPEDFVVVDFVARNEFYEDDFDKNNIVPPVCVAIGSNPKKLVPMASSPSKQCDDCAGCPMNAFGSKGKGKACSNTYVLAVLPPDADESTPMATIKVSATSMRSFDAFVQHTARTFQTPPVGVVVSVGFDSNETYPKLVFGDAVPNENLAVHFSRQVEAQEMLNAEPDFTPREAMAKPKNAARRPATAARR
jgi:hypothetical protein